MHRTALRLSGFAVVLAVLFTGGWAVGAQFPTDDDPSPHEMDHTNDEATDHAETDHDATDHDATDHDATDPGTSTDEEAP